MTNTFSFFSMLLAMGIASGVVGLILFSLLGLVITYLIRVVNDDHSKRIKDREFNEMLERTGRLN